MGLCTEIRLVGGLVVGIGGGGRSDGSEDTRMGKVRGRGVGTWTDERIRGGAREGGEGVGRSETHGREIGVSRDARGGRGAEGGVVVVHHVLRLVGHGHVAGVEAAIRNERGIGCVLGGLHLHLGLLCLAFVLHAPVLEPGLDLQE